MQNSLQISKWAIQISTASISFIASVTMAISIKTSKDSLSTPYRRLIFGLSVSDILQSSALITGPFAAPSGTPQALWAVGNESTCNINAFVLLTGMIAVPMYTLALCIYYSCRLKDKLDDQAFYAKVERWMHIFIVGWNVVVSGICWATHSFNPHPTGAFCLVHSPKDCDENMETSQKCEAEERNGLVIIMVAPAMICFVGIVYFMVALVWHAMSKLQMFSLIRSVAETSNLQQPSHSDSYSSDSSSDSSESGNIHLGEELACSLSPADLSALNNSISVTSSDYGFGRAANNSISVGSSCLKLDPELNVLNNSDNKESPNCVLGRELGVSKYSMVIEASDDMSGLLNLSSPRNSSTREHSDSQLGLELGAWRNSDSVKSFQSQTDLTDKRSRTSGEKRRESTKKLFKSLESGSDMDAHEGIKESDLRASEQKLTETYKKEIVLQAISYIGMYIIVYIMPLVSGAFEMAGISPPPSAVPIITSIFYPLGGLFNILVHTRPNVAAIRRRRPEYSWFKSFWMVLRTGGDLPDLGRDSCHAEPPSMQSVISLFGLSSRPSGFNMNKAFSNKVPDAARRKLGLLRRAKLPGSDKIPGACIDAQVYESGNLFSDSANLITDGTE